MYPPTLPSEPGGQPQTSTVVMRSKGKWATPDEWTAARPIIKQLYMEQDTPLKEVMSIMETQHSFHGTIKMYKNKLNEWGFFKTFKPREVLDALRILEAREAEGERDPKLTMRGIEVDMDWIRGYLKRNRKRINKINRRQAQAAEAADASRNDMVVDMMIMVTGSSPSGSSASPPRLSLATPGHMKLAEDMLIAMNTYVESAMSRGLWFVDPSGFYRSKKCELGNYYLFDFWDRLDVASQAMKRAEQINLVGLLNPAFSHLKEIVCEEDPRSFPFLLGVFEVLRTRGRLDLLEALLRYIWQLSSTLLGPNCPHSGIWKQCYSIFRTGIQDEIIERVFLLLMDRYHTHNSGRNHVTAPGTAISPYSTSCGIAINLEYKKYLEGLECGIRQELDEIEAADQCFDASANSSPEPSPVITTPTTTALFILSTDSAYSTTTTTTTNTAHRFPHHTTTNGDTPTTLDTLPPASLNAARRRRLTHLRSQYTTAVRELLRRQGQFAEAEEALAVLSNLSPSYTTPPSPFVQDRSLALRNLAQSRLAAGDAEAAEHFMRVAGHLADNPSIYRDEGWINWIFEGMTNVFQGGQEEGGDDGGVRRRDMGAELERLRRTRECVSHRGRGRGKGGGAGAGAGAGAGVGIGRASGGVRVKEEETNKDISRVARNINRCAGAPGAGCPRAAPPPTNCPLSKMFESKIGTFPPDEPLQPTSWGGTSGTGLDGRISELVPELWETADAFMMAAGEREVWGRFPSGTQWVDEY